MKQYAKALVGGLIAALSSAGTTIQSNSHFGVGSLITAIIAGLATFSGVAFTPYLPNTNTPQK